MKSEPPIGQQRGNIWNRTTKRDKWGQKRPTDRPVSEWLRVDAEELWIVSDALWNAAHRQLTERRSICTENRPAAAQALDPRGRRQSYLLSGPAVRSVAPPCRRFRAHPPLVGCFGTSAGHT